MRKALLLLGAFALTTCGSHSVGTQVLLPGGNVGIGFDDLRYSASLHQVLVPAGRSGNVVLIDPDTLKISSVSGFGSVAAYSGGHDDGPTSIDESPGFLYVTDRTEQALLAVDKRTLRILGKVPLKHQPDYVRYVASTKELWVTEPGADQIEVFSIGEDGMPIRTNAVVPVSNGPESLVLDEPRGLAYSHRWKSSTVAIDLRRRQIVAEWPNDCTASRGIALDEKRGFLFAVCREGTVSVLDVARGGKILSTLTRGSGFDVVGYAPALGHLYLAGSSCACLVTMGVSPAGKLTLLGREPAPKSTHCAVADDKRHVWVCDPENARIWRMNDSFAPSF